MNSPVQSNDTLREGIWAVANAMFSKIYLDAIDSRMPICELDKVDKNVDKPVRELVRIRVGNTACVHIDNQIKNNL